MDFLLLCSAVMYRRYQLRIPDLEHRDTAVIDLRSKLLNVEHRTNTC
jgi:hypothetical protein